MSCEPKRKGDNRQRWIGKSAGGKNRAPGNEEIRHVMHSAIGIDYAVPGVVVHSCGAHEVMRAVEWQRLRADSLLRRHEGADTGGRQVAAENLLGLSDAVQIQLIPTPNHSGFTLTKDVGLLPQHDTVGTVRRLLDETADAKFTEAAVKPGES